MGGIHARIHGYRIFNSSHSYSHNNTYTGMLEFIKHLLGVCGEHTHPTIWTFLAGGVSFSTMWCYIRGKFAKKVEK